MKQVDRVQTFDGELHGNDRAAKKHLDVLYSNAITGLAHRFVRSSNGKYGRTAEFIDENLQSFIDLKEIKDDMQMEEKND